MKNLSKKNNSGKIAINTKKILIPRFTLKKQILQKKTIDQRLILLAITVLVVIVQEKRTKITFLRLIEESQ